MHLAQISLFTVMAMSAVLDNDVEGSHGDCDEDKDGIIKCDDHHENYVDGSGKDKVKVLFAFVDIDDNDDTNVF